MPEDKGWIKLMVSPIPGGSRVLRVGSAVQKIAGKVPPISWMQRAARAVWEHDPYALDYDPADAYIWVPQTADWVRCSTNGNNAHTVLHLLWVDPSTGKIHETWPNPDSEIMQKRFHGDISQLPAWATPEIRQRVEREVALEREKQARAQAKKGNGSRPREKVREHSTRAKEMSRT